MWFPPSFRTVNFQVVWGAGAITNRTGPGNAMTGQKKRRQRSFVNGAVTRLVQSYILNIFHFHLYLEKWSSLTKIFQMGWFNHQLVYLIYPPMKLTARPWKFYGWNMNFPFGFWPPTRCELLVSGSVTIASWCKGNDLKAGSIYRIPVTRGSDLELLGCPWKLATS